MKVLLFSSIMACALFTTAQAEETIKEKVTVKAKTVVREVKKGVNRAEEAVCGKLTGDSKTECLTKKATNRVVETKDAVVDKVDEVKGAVDSKK